jgi:phosphopantetheine--protein transferase-like protein
MEPLAPSPAEHGVRGRALELVTTAELQELLAARETTAFTPRELAFAQATKDPARRLAARLAAKRAARRLLGEDLELAELEVARGRNGPPAFVLSERARRRLAELHAVRMLVSLTHERDHAAALVLLLEAT